MLHQKIQEWTTCVIRFARQWAEYSGPQYHSMDHRHTKVCNVDSSASAAWSLSMPPYWAPFAMELVKLTLTKEDFWHSQHEIGFLFSHIFHLNYVFFLLANLPSCSLVWRTVCTLDNVFCGPKYIVWSTFFL